MRLKRTLIYSLILFFVFSFESLFCEIPENYTLYGESDSLKLYFEEEQLSLAVLHKTSGQEWYSGYNDYSYSDLEMTDFWMDRFNSLLEITYTDLTLESNKTKTVNLNRVEKEWTIDKIPNGFNLNLDIEELKISFTVQIVLDDEALVLRIPDETLRESVGVLEAIAGIVEGLETSFLEMENEFSLAKNAGRFQTINEEISDISYDLGIFRETLDSIDGVNNLEYMADDGYFYMLDVRRKLKGYQGQRNVLGELEKLKGDPQAEQALVHYNNMYRLSMKLLGGMGSLKEIVAAGIVSIDPLPFFGAAGDREKGYMLYPDGSGALTYFKEDHPEWNEFYSKDIYSPDIIDFDRLELETGNGLKEIHFPVWGISKEQGGLLAVVAEGAEMSSLNFYPSGYQVNLNRTGATFRYRREYDAAGSSHNVNAEGYERASRSGIITKEKIGGDKAIRYIFLDRDESDYSGMALTYRRYLQEQNLLPGRLDDVNSMPLAVDFLGGIMENRILFNRFIPMTTFEDMERISFEISQWGVDEMTIGLRGWTKGGYGVYPAEAKPDRRLGGRGDLNKLAATIENLGFGLFLHVNVIDARKDKGDFSIYGDVIRGRNQIQETDRFRNDYVFTPYVVQEQSSDFQEFAAQLEGSVGLHFDRLGSYLYFDENRESLMSRQDTADVFKEIASGDGSDPIGLSEANAYLMAGVERIIGIPEESTGYFYTDRSIPFYQMVIHGTIPYSATPFNLFYDKKYQTLKAVEMGAMPYYFITNLNAEELKYTDFTQLFSPAFDDWRSDMRSVWNDFNENLTPLYNSYMISHEYPQEKLCAVTYDRGYKVLINYNDSEVFYDGHRVGAMDYLVIREEGDKQ